MISICKAEGITPTADELDHWVRTEKSRIMAAFREHGLQPTPGTPEAMAFLLEAGIAHPVVTSSAPDRVELTLDVAGLTKYFDRVRDPIFSAQAPDFTGRAKPEPDIYDLAFSKYPELSVRLAEEDSPSGARAAVASGAVVIGNVGAQRSADAQTERAKVLLGVGATLAVANNESLIGLVQHLQQFDRPFLRETVEHFLRDGGWVHQFARNEERAGRPIWLSDRLS